MKEYLKQKYNILIPIFLIVVVVVALIVYGREYRNNRYAETKDIKVYQYFSGIKMEYTGLISKNRKNVILAFEPKDEVVNLDSIPIYTEKKTVIFPKEMTIFFPLENKIYRTNPLAEIYTKNNLIYLNQKNVDNVFDHVFYFDGGDLYFFIDPVTIKIGDKEINLTSKSYINCLYQNLLEYYDYENDKYDSISLTNEKVYVYNDYMKIDVTLDKVVYNDNFTLLSSDFSNLNKIYDSEKIKK